MSLRQLFVFPTLDSTWRTGYMGWLTQCLEDRGIRAWEFQYTYLWPGCPALCPAVPRAVKSLFWGIFTLAHWPNPSSPAPCRVGLSIDINPGHFPTWDRSKSDCNHRACHTETVKILGDNGRRKLQDQSQGKATQILSSRSQRTQGGTQMPRGIANHRTPQGIHLFLGQNQQV